MCARRREVSFQMKNILSRTTKTSFAERVVIRYSENIVLIFTALFNPPEVVYEPTG